MFMIFHVAPEILKTQSKSSENHWRSNHFLGFQRINEPPNGLVHSNMEYITIVPSYGSNKSSPDFLWANWTQPQHKVWRINESNAKHARFIELDSSWPQMCQWEQNSWGMGNSESDGFFPPPSCTQVKASKVYTTRPRVKFHPSQTYWIAPHK